MLMIESTEGMLLHRRPESGIWAGLWSLPECPVAADPTRWVEETLGLTITLTGENITMRHEFTHFTLDIQALAARADSATGMREGDWVWYNPNTSSDRGLPAPVKKLIDNKEHRS